MTKEEYKKYKHLCVPTTIAAFFEQNLHNPHIQSEEMFMSLMDTMLHYQGELEKVKVKEGAIAMTEAAHEFIDEELKKIPEDIKRKISCRRGCAHCCHIHVDISWNEGKALLERVLQDKLPLSRARMEAQKGTTIETRMDMKGDRRCVFLSDDNECRVYDVRPAACRNHIVTSPPAKCDSIANRHGKTDIYFNMQAELMNGALMNLEPGGEMNEILLQQIKNLPNGVSRITWLQETDGGDEHPATPAIS